MAGCSYRAEFEICLDANNSAFPSKSMGSDPTMRMLLPVCRSFWAIAAGYLGLISILFLPALFALITGIFAVLDIKKNPEKHSIGRAIFGIAMGVLFSALIMKN